MCKYMGRPLDCKMKKARYRKNLYSTILFMWSGAGHLSPKYICTEEGSGSIHKRDAQRKHYYIPGG